MAKTVEGAPPRKRAPRKKPGAAAPAGPETQRGQGFWDPQFKQPYARDVLAAEREREIASQRAYEASPEYANLPPASTQRSVQETPVARQAIEERLLERKHPVQPLVDELRAKAAALEEEYYPGSERRLLTPSQLNVLGKKPAKKRKPPTGPRQRRRPPGGYRDQASACKHQAIMKAIDESDGNVAEAARRLGLARQSVYRVLQRMGLKVTKGGSDRIRPA